MPQASVALLVMLVALAGVIGYALWRLRVNGEVLERLSSSRGLEGRHVIVNTRRPDDQSIRGWVRREHPDGALELAQAVYLEPGEAGGVVTADAGDVWLPASSISWVQLDVPAPAAPERK